MDPPPVSVGGPSVASAVRGPLPALSSLPPPLSVHTTRNTGDDFDGFFVLPFFASPVPISQCPECVGGFHSPVAFSSIHFASEREADRERKREGRKEGERGGEKGKGGRKERGEQLLILEL